MFKATILQNPDNGLEFTLKIENVKMEANTALRVRLVDADKFFMPSYSGYCILPVMAEESFIQATFSMPQILACCGATNLNSRVLEFSLVHGKDDGFVGVDPDFRDIQVETPLVTYRLCLGRGGNLVLRLKWEKLLVGSQTALLENGLRVRLAEKREGCLALRHRIEHDILRFDRETRYNALEAGLYHIAYQDLINQTATDRDLFCLYFHSPATKTAPGYYYRVVTEEDAAQRQYGDHTVVACRVKDKTASVAVRRELPVVPVSGISDSGNRVKFTFEGLVPSALKLHRVMTIPASDNDAPNSFVQEDAWVIPGETVPLSHWEDMHPNMPLCYQLFAEADGRKYRVICREPYEKRFELGCQTVFVAGDGEGCFIRVSERPNKIRLGILGTCMTRWAFSSKYTDAYRPLYEVAFAHFWPSVFSLTEEAAAFPEHQFEGYSETERSFALREYQKTSLKELKDARCEYVLVDFFVDAIHGPRRLKDGKFIGYKAYARDFYQDFLMFDSDKYYLDSNDYFLRWTQAADRMIEALLGIVPQNRIVLAIGGLTHYFLSGEGKVECFDGMTLRNSHMTKHSINALNYLWDKMNAYFMAKLPGAQVLSMREYGFLAHDRDPVNVRPYHFQNAYYRALSAELSRIILRDRQNR